MSKVEPIGDGELNDLRVDLDMDNCLDLDPDMARSLILRLDDAQDALVQVVRQRTAAESERDALQAIVDEQASVLSDCRSDIFQTARTNQANLTGHDITSPEDPPIKQQITRCRVSQRGINESLALIKRIEEVARAAGNRSA